MEETINLTNGKIVKTEDKLLYEHGLAGNSMEISVDWERFKKVVKERSRNKPDQNKTKPKT